MGAVSVILMCIATVYDLDISVAAVGARENSAALRMVSYALQIIGEWPGPIFGSFAAAIIVRSLAARTEKYRALAWRLSGFALEYILMLYCVRATLKPFEEYRAAFLISCIMIPASLALIITRLTAIIPEKTLAELFVPALVTFFAALAVLITVQFTKMLWGRIRFRDFGEDISRFVPWYKIDFFSGYNSFPSGHTANMAIIFAFPLWLAAIGKSRKTVGKPPGTRGGKVIKQSGSRPAQPSTSMRIVTLSQTTGGRTASKPMPQREDPAKQPKRKEAGKQAAKQPEQKEAEKQAAKQPKNEETGKQSARRRRRPRKRPASENAGKTAGRSAAGGGDHEE